MARITKKQDEIIQSMVKTAQQAVKEIAEEIATRIEIAYEDSIDSFYKHYPEPRMYRRTNASYYASNGFGTKRLLKNGIKKNREGYLVGIIVDAGNMEKTGSGGYWGDPYRADEEWVFRRTFEEGIHGMTPEEVKKAEWLKPGKGTPYYRYPIIQGRTPWEKSPMSKDKTPQARMEKEYKKIYDQLDKVTKEKMDEAFGRMG